MMNFQRIVLRTSLALLLAMFASIATGQSYPARPVRLIIPFPPGGSNDIVGRMIAAQLGERLGQQVVVDNRGGAGGTIGTELAAKAPADGYTLLLISSRLRLQHLDLQEAAVRSGEVVHTGDAARQRTGSAGSQSRAPGRIPLRS